MCVDETSSALDVDGRDCVDDDGGGGFVGGCVGRPFGSGRWFGVGVIGWRIDDYVGIHEGDGVKEREECFCRCRYTCGKRCELSAAECFEKHHVRECGHDFSGALTTQWRPDLGVTGSSKTCVHCGLAAFVHDIRLGKIIGRRG